LDKGEVDELDRNKQPVLLGFADLGFLNSGFRSTFSKSQEEKLSLFTLTFEASETARYRKPPTEKLCFSQDKR
jgi:hypothetical protein